MAKFVFFGTPRFAELVLAGLIQADLKPELVVCNPDRPVGRKKVITPPPTKVLAEKNNIPVFQPEKVSSQIDWPINWRDIDFSVVAAYAQIIPQELINQPKMGTLGIHPSWLPKYRGASPIQSALLAGEELTAVVVYQMDAKVDHGPTLYGIPVKVSTDENYLSLEKKLGEKGAEALTKMLPDFLIGKIEKREQDHNQATLTKKFETKDGEVDMEKDALLEIYRKIRALNPEPGVFTLNFPDRIGKRVKLLSAKFANDELRITKIKPEGKGEIKL